MWCDSSVIPEGQQEGICLKYYTPTCSEENASNFIGEIIIKVEDDSNTKSLMSGLILKVIYVLSNFIKCLPRHLVCIYEKK